VAKKTTRELLLKAKDSGVTGVKKNVSGLRSEVGQLEFGWGTAGKAAGLAMAATTVAVAAGGAAVGAFGKSIIDTGAQVEIYRIKLRTVIRDQEKADKLFRELITFAATTPFELPGIIEAAIQLESFGHDAMELLPVIGDTAAAMGADIYDAALAYTQGVTGEMEMLKRFTITGAQLTEEVGKFNRGTVEGMDKAAAAIETLMRRRFGGGMEEMRKSWDGTLSMFADHWFVLKQKIAEGGVFDTAKGDLREILQLVDDFAGRGGVDAIAIGLNNAFGTIHKQFFGGMFDDMNNLQFNAALLAGQIEHSVLRVVTEIVTAYDAMILTFKTGPAVLAEVARVAAKDIGAPSPLWSLFSDAEARKAHTTDLRARIEEIGYAMDNIRKHAAAGTDPSPEALRILNVPQELLRKAKEYDFVGPMLPVMEEAGAVAGAAFVDAFTQTLGDVSPWEAFTGPPTPEEHLFAQQFDELALWEADLGSYYEWKADQDWKSAEFEISSREVAVQSQRRMFDELSRYHAIFVKKGMHVGRALNSMLIRGSVEVGKAGIEQLVRQSKIEAAFNTAKAISAAASFNFASAAKYAAAAAKHGLISGAGGLASAYLDNYADEREQALIGGTEGTATFDTMGESGRGRRHRGTASTVRTGNQVNNYYISVNQNVGGDYVAGMTTEEDITNTVIQALDERTVA
jgi:hypothetical protein